MPAVSKSQQRLMGQAYAYRTGKLKKKDINPTYFEHIKNLSKQMKLKDLKKYASTRHSTRNSKLPDTVAETVVSPFSVYVAKYYCS